VDQAPDVDASAAPPPAGAVIDVGVSIAVDATASWSLDGGGGGTTRSADTITTSSSPEMVPTCGSDTICETAVSATTRSSPESSAAASEGSTDEPNTSVVMTNMPQACSANGSTWRLGARFGRRIAHAQHHTLQRREAEHAGVGVATEKEGQGLKSEKIKGFETTRTPGARSYILEWTRVVFAGRSDKPGSGMPVWPQLTRKPAPGAPLTQGLARFSPQARGRHCY
jgi:hypothetical protein